METGTAFEPGAVVGGDFVVKKLLGEGGMGAVYTAEQTSTGKLRALKVMHKGIVPDRAQKRRFEQEAKVGSLIKSGHVVEVIAAGIDAERGLPFLVMELLDGTDLRKHLEARARLPAAEVRALFEQLCHGVAAAHAVDVVHRDLKPENIFLARSNRAGSLETVVKVLDFGIAKLAAETGTRATAAIGSPLWMAPEQTAPGPVTPAADVWALGLIAYELLTGEHFWRSASTPTATPMHLLREIVLDPIPPASERGGAFLPPGFDAWFARCIARDPAERFQDAGQLWQAMAEMLPPRDGENVTTDPFARTAAAPPLLRSDPPAALPVGNTPLVIIGQSFPPEPPPTLRAESRALPRGAVWLAVGIVGLLGVLGGVAIGERHPENVAVTPPGTVSAAALGAQSVPAVPPVPPIPPIPPIPAIPPIPPIPPIPAIPPIPPIPAIPSVAHGKHVATDTADEPPPAPTSPLRDGFGNPHDPARQGRDIDAPRQTVIQGHHVRLFTRLVSNQSNVADPVVRSAIDYSSWEYERCYERAFGAAKDLPGGTVTVGFDIEQQLPRRARLESSTFGGTVMGPCVLQTLSGQTVNAAGPDGAGHVVYGFRYVVMD